MLSLAMSADFAGNSLQAKTHNQSGLEQTTNSTESTFNERIKMIGKQFFNTSGLKPNAEETKALHFLYAYMPLADVTDYPTSFYLKNIRSSFKAKKEMPWGNKIPDLLFKHFVLPIRVNNEALDSSRMVFYDELKQRVKGKSMYDAILEVNHWCHEKVTYQPSDARTSSPLATVRTSTGRCGEESTFAVAALRSVGIPARQVYTPRWAHTDDNHAWVEAWADGKWHFLGACEPEPVLDLGWFNSPASRAMLMHTRAFGDYAGPEEVLLKTSNFTEINLTSNYAPVATVDFVVVDENNKPVDNARVDFKIYNYAELYTAVTKYTNSLGETNLTAGRGDLVAWVSKNGNFAYKKVTFGKDKKVTITLDDKASKGYIETEDTFDIVPPPEKLKVPYVSEQMRKENQKRFDQEDSIRKAYTSTFPTLEEAKQISVRGAEFIFKSRGNSKTIISFIQRHKDNEGRALALLATLSDKDLRDITTDILEDSYQAKSDQLSPRVEDEMIILPFKKYFEKKFKKSEQQKFAGNPQLLVDWIKQNIRLYPDKKALQIAQTPVGAMEARMTDNRSRDIFFVDVARSLGINARKDKVTSKLQYFKEGKWVDVSFEEKAETETPKGVLKLSFKPTKHIDNPKYYSHFTISKIENGTTKLLNLDEGQADMGSGTNWESMFKGGFTLDEGQYLLTTGSRLADGTVLATNKFFKIEGQKETDIDLKVRQQNAAVSVIGTFDSESLVNKDGKTSSILSLTGRGYYVMGIITAGQEPTNHALHDIEKLKEKFEAWGRPLVLLFEDKASAKKLNKAEFAKLPSTSIFATDEKGAIKDQIAAQMKLEDKNRLPIFIIADTFNRVVFISQGYTIGLGEQLINTINKL